jgi:hypothetical protein
MPIAPGASTVSGVLPETPARVAETVVVPAPAAAARPVALTVATPGLEDAQTT